MSTRIPTLLVLMGCMASCESVLAQAPPPATIVTGAVRKYLLNAGGQVDGTQQATVPNSYYWQVPLCSVW